MKLNHECVRDLLLYLEENLKFNKSKDLTRIDFKKFGYTEETVLYAATKLIEAGFLNGESISPNSPIMWFSIYSITWDGHEFLDNIRDNSIWNSAKNLVSHLANVSLPILAKTAADLVIKNITIPS